MNEAKKNFWDAMTQGLYGLGGLMRQSPKEPEIEADEFLLKALACLDKGKAAHARQTEAVELARWLRTSQAKPGLFKAMLGALSVGLGADRKRVAAAVAQIDWEDVDMSKMEQDMMEAMGSRRRRLCQLWLTMEGALAFFVWLRERVLEQSVEDQALGPLRGDLDEIMETIFSPGLLQMSAITWRAPTMVLERIMERGRERGMGSWDDLKSRLGADRRMYAMFHPGWEDEPLAFVEVALTRGQARSAADMLGARGPKEGSRADTATFFVIHAPHAGLQGIALSECLVQRAIDALHREQPQIKNFCVLAPIPGFAAWLGALGQSRFEELCGADMLERLSKKAGPEAPKMFLSVLGQPGWFEGPMGEASRETMERLGAKYLALAPESMDGMARFHLENRARIEGMRHLADVSKKGLAQSHGMMVGYLYAIGGPAIGGIAREGVEPTSWIPHWPFVD